MYYNEAKKNKTETQIKERKVRSNENLTFYPIQSKKEGTVQWRPNVLPHPNQIWKVPAQKIVMFAPSNLEKEVQSTEDIVFYPIQI